MANFRGPYSVDSGLANNGWHKSPTMYAGGWLNAWRDEDGLIHYMFNVQSSIRSGSSYGYPVTVQTLYRGRVVDTYIASNGNFNTNSAENTVRDNEAGSFEIRYICGQTGGCTKGYGTNYMVNTETGRTALVTLGSWSLRNPSVPGNQKVNGGYEAVIKDRNETVRLTWDGAGRGTYDISHYRVYFSRGRGWELIIPNIAANQREARIHVSDFYNDMPRGSSIGYIVTAVDVKGNESSKPNGALDWTKITFVDPSSETGGKTINASSIVVYWKSTSGVRIRSVNWKFDYEGNDKWRNVASNIEAVGGEFTVSGLTYNTRYLINVRLTTYTDGYSFINTANVKTKDIARITKYQQEWSVEDPTELTISNPANCSLQLYISYNNIEIISRNNIKLENNKYTLTLTEDEKVLLYTQAAADSNPSFKFILKSFESIKVGEHAVNTKITFPTKAWVRVDNNWKRALVWQKVGSTWKQCIPWVKVGSTWKRI